MVFVRVSILSFLLLPTMLLARDPFKEMSSNILSKSQVLVQAKIVRINSDCVNDFGFEWHDVVRNRYRRSGLSLSTPETQGLFNFHLVNLSDNRLITLQLRAMESSGYGEVIAKPRLLISNGKTAFIESGEQIPYTERVGSESTATVFKKAVLGLKVKPRVLPHHKIELDLTVTQDKAASARSDQVPNIHTAVLQTSVVVADGQTVVLGGIYDNSKQTNISGVPWLKDIPIIGAMFRRRSVSNIRSEVLIFVHSAVVPPLSN